MDTKTYLEARDKSAALFETHDRRMEEMMEDEGNAGFKKARVEHEQPPSNPSGAEESDSESTFEKEQNEIAEDSALSAPEERRSKRSE